MGLPYLPPEEVTVFECQHCRCRFNTLEDYDEHYSDQHGHGLLFNISIDLPPED